MTHPQSPLRLSVCIPTHHGRRAELQQAIESILPQIAGLLQGQVEICVSDNASEDGTQALMERFLQEHPGLFAYCRHPENLGLARNVLAAVNLAHGDYCWLLSSDDALTDQALPTVLLALAENPSLAGISVNLGSYDPSLTRLLQTGLPRALAPQHPTQRQIFTSPQQILRECGSAQGCFSMQIFDRRLWLQSLSEMGEASYLRFRYFPYVYVFGKMVKKRPQWMWLPEALVKIRTENDFLYADMGRSLLKYHQNISAELAVIWGELLGGSNATYQALMRDNYQCFWHGRVLLHYKLRHSCTAADEARALGTFTRLLFFLPHFWIATLPVLLVPHRILRAVYAAYQRTGCASIMQALRRRLAPQAQQ